ncbi:exported hypothetical protein [Rhodococcus sp. RD6.2]|uniref:hypothetical protein n=1 Tax=Rhodococcus sp. RD6.2 TaxID=260936 RepID=UPI00063B865E|nr:hypothetical protein [Rhodococcus sp. RD6.2]CRK53307.1 exported hypothetical protein [Rhodococcus sp. RD6.2]
MKRSIIVALAGATIALGTVTSASAAPTGIDDPALPVPWAGSSSGSADFFYPHDGQNAGSTDLAQASGSNDLGNIVFLAPFRLLCWALTGQPLQACIPDNL